MKKKSNIFGFLSLSMAAGLVLIGGNMMEADAQTRDPFSKPGWARTRENRTGGATTGAAQSNKPKVDPLNPVGVPAIEQRIEYYKRLRENAVMNGTVVPKVTSVLTLNEMAVTGIFRTPRGYAAMVEATPIKLSYTIYPGEKFFDGQLVAVEENRLVFRRVSKLNNGKFVSSVENKPLRQYTTQETIQGTAPVQTEGRPPETVAAYQPASGEGQAPAAKAPTAAQIMSPLDEMNRQMPETDAEKAEKAKGKKKPVRLAKSKK